MQWNFWKGSSEVPYTPQMCFEEMERLGEQLKSGMLIVKSINWMNPGFMPCAETSSSGFAVCVGSYSTRRSWKLIEGFPPRSLKRKGMSFEVLGKKVYLLGGCWVECYFACEVLNGKIYAIGGSIVLDEKIYIRCGTSALTSHVYAVVYNPSHGTWQHADADMVLGWQGPAVVVDGTLYVLDQRLGTRLMMWQKESRKWGWHRCGDADADEGRDAESGSVHRGDGRPRQDNSCQEVYNHSDVKQHFNCHAWVYVSQEFKAREICLGLPIVLCFMMKRRKEVWSSLRSYLPEAKDGSKVLITTRNEEIALHATSQEEIARTSLNSKKKLLTCQFTRLIYRLRIMNDDESWRSFSRKLLGTEVHQEACYPQREDKSSWEKVLASIDWHLSQEDYEKKTLLNHLRLKRWKKVVEEKTLIPGLMLFTSHLSLQGDLRWKVGVARGNWILSSKSPRTLFNHCELKNDPMFILEKLPKLKVLILSSGPYVGKKLVCSSGGFLQLQSLELRVYFIRGINSGGRSIAHLKTLQIEVVSEWKSFLVDCYN
ncbi:F-box/kelch-repeat protein SKIP4 [Vitis vinifera]|uniref:F-box/kelch-repeat protein SKIP4 n=1 Tax=Vitis vinifera TaxID=29760 RepID=A0A438H9J0_VITVI|nr:F-box/kelch-repeat protein SKIP4 [Vitis vinifera]